ncbi:MAG: peptidoglycan amidohydrolase family protein [Peptoniphilaceae bacterium]|nr:peptidoglycan amidohydrolase family protein [Peptoniphilaceae bacterium]
MKKKIPALVMTVAVSVSISQTKTYAENLEDDFNNLTLNLNEENNNENIYIEKTDILEENETVENTEIPYPTEENTTYLNENDNSSLEDDTLALNEDEYVDENSDYSNEEETLNQEETVDSTENEEITEIPNTFSDEDLEKSYDDLETENLNYEEENENIENYSENDEFTENDYLENSNENVEDSASESINTENSLAYTNDLNSNDNFNSEEDNSISFRSSSENNNEEYINEEETLEENNPTYIGEVLSTEEVLNNNVENIENNTLTENSKENEEYATTTSNFSNTENLNDEEVEETKEESEDNLKLDKEETIENKTSENISLSDNFKDNNKENNSEKDTLTLEKEDEKAKETEENYLLVDKKVFKLNGDVLMPVLNSWVKIDDKDYFTDSQATILEGLYRIGQDFYAFTLEKGLLKNKKFFSNKKIYDASDDGLVKLFKNSRTGQGEDSYFTNDEGYVLKEEIKTIDDKNYYFAEDGKLQKNTKFIKDDKFYIASSDGSLSSPKSKWAGIGKNSYYTDENGNIIKNTLKEINGNTYYFGNDGVVKTSMDGVNDPRIGSIAKTGVIKAPVDKWINYSGKIYKTDENGNYITGLKEINGKKYIFDSDNSLITSKDVIYKNKAYKALEDGTLSEYKSLWLTIDGNKYYVDSNGNLLKGISIVDEKKYAFDEKSGVLLKSTKVTIGSVEYTIDENGLVVKEKKVSASKDLDKMVDWFYKAKKDGLYYSMDYPARESSYAADCSSAVFRAMIAGGFLPKGSGIGNTETLFAMGDKASIMYEIPESEVRYGDIFVSGYKGSSSGAGGHTGLILERNKIIHMSYSNNGVAITPKDGGYMGDYNGRPVHFYRLVGGHSEKENI